MFCFLRMHPQWLLFRQYIARLFEMPELEFEQKNFRQLKNWQIITTVYTGKENNIKIFE